MADWGMLELPITLTPSINVAVAPVLAPRILPLSPSSENTPPTVVATAFALRFGILDISSAVTVAPEAV